MTGPPDPTPTQPWASNRTGRRGFTQKVARFILRRDKDCQLGYPGCQTTPTQADHMTPWAEAILLGWTPSGSTTRTTDRPYALRVMGSRHRPRRNEVAPAPAPPGPATAQPHRIQDSSADPSRCGPAAEVTEGGG